MEFPTVLTRAGAVELFSYTAKADPPLPGDTLPQMADWDGLIARSALTFRTVNPRDHATDFGLPVRDPAPSFHDRGITYGSTMRQGFAVRGLPKFDCGAVRKMMQVW